MLAASIGLELLGTGTGGIAGISTFPGLAILGRLLSNGPVFDCAGSKGPLFIVFMRLSTFSLPLLPTGLLGSDIEVSANLPSDLESAREEPRSLPGVFRPLLDPGRLPGALSPKGNGGKAQSRFAESSGLGGRGSHSRGMGVVMLLCGADGRPLMLLPDLELGTGDMGDAGRGRGARKGLFAASGLICGSGARGILEDGGTLDPSVGALDRVCRGGLSNCKGDGCAGFELLAFICRRVNGLLSEAGWDLGEGGALEQVWSPIAEISISSPQLEHVMVGRKLAGRIPLAARVADSGMVVVPSRSAAGIWYLVAISIFLRGAGRRLAWFPAPRSGSCC